MNERTNARTAINNYYSNSIRTKHEASEDSSSNNNSTTTSRSLSSVFYIPFTGLRDAFPIFTSFSGKFLFNYRARLTDTKNQHKRLIFHEEQKDTHKVHKHLTCGPNWRQRRERRRATKTTSVRDRISTTNDCSTVCALLGDVRAWRTLILTKLTTTRLCGSSRRGSFVSLVE